MNRAIKILLVISTICLTTPSSAQAITYKNCSQINKKYPGGISRSASTVNQGGATKFDPYVSTSLYKKYKSKDRDKDGIACER